MRRLLTGLALLGCGVGGCQEAGEAGTSSAPAVVRVLPSAAEAPEPASERVAWAEGIAPSSGFRARQQDYLDLCAATAQSGGTYAQLCLLERGIGPLNESSIRASLDKMNAREDTADFRANAILRMLLLYGDSPVLSPQLKAEMEFAVLNFKYWLDEPGPDDLCWWSENHQILFHTAEILAGVLFPDQIFPNSGMTGRAHVEHGLPLARQWLDRRGIFGFSEWLSNIYYNEDIPALVNLVDFAPDEDVAIRAAMTLDLMTFNLGTYTYQGVLGTVHGRTYSRSKIGGTNDDTTEAGYVLLGLGTPTDLGNFSATFLSTSPRYWPPELLERISDDGRAALEHRERNGIEVDEGPSYGIGYEAPEDVIFWWGMGAYAAPKVIDGTLATVEFYDLWDDYFWDSVAFLEPYVDSPIYTPVTALLRDISYGSVLGAMSSYLYRTPDYQLSGAQDFHPGYWGAQQHLWQATLSPDAVVFTTAPGGLEGDYTATDWTGGWLPRATFHQNVGVIQYDRRAHPIGSEVMFVELTHAYFPTWAFDEWLQADGWIFGRKGDGYIALTSRNPLSWSVDAPDYELVAEGSKNVFLVELGRYEAQGGYADWVAAIRDAALSFTGETVQYQSPSQGLVEVGATGPMRVQGRPVDIGPHERFDSRYVQQSFGSNRTTLTFDGQALELNWALGTRTVRND